MEEIRQLLRLEVEDLDAVAADAHLQVGRDRVHQLAAERLRLPREVVAARDERSEPAGVCGELLEQRTIHVVAHADAEDFRVARAGTDQLEQRAPLALLGHAVAEDHDIQRAIGVGVFVSGRERRIEHRAAVRLRRGEEGERVLLRLCIRGALAVESEARLDVEGHHLEAVLRAELIEERADAIFREQQLAVVAHAAGDIEHEDIVRAGCPCPARLRRR